MTSIKSNVRKVNANLDGSDATFSIQLASSFSQRFSFSSALLQKIRFLAGGGGDAFGLSGRRRVKVVAAPGWLWASILPP